MLKFGMKIHPGLIFIKINNKWFCYGPEYVPWLCNTSLPSLSAVTCYFTSQGSKVKLIMLRLTAAPWCLHTLKPSSFWVTLVICWVVVGLTCFIENSWNKISSCTDVQKSSWWTNMFGDKGKSDTNQLIWLFDEEAFLLLPKRARVQQEYLYLLVDLIFRSKIIAKIAFGLNYCIVVSRK